MIKVENLSKNYSGHWALKNATWTVDEKRTVGLLGPNGAGKSTTMKMMTGLLAPTAGRVLVDGEDVTLRPQHTKALMGYLPEAPPLYDELTVGGYLKFVAGLKGLTKAQRRVAVPEALEKLNLQAVELKPIAQLSKGFRQRVGIAQALVANPPVLILDEPSVGLDPQQVFELRNVIRDLKKDHTIILSTHVLSEVEHICDDVVILNEGEVKAVGPLKDILERKGHKFELRIEVKSQNEALLNKMRALPDVDEVQYRADKRSIAVYSTRQLECMDPILKVALDNGAGIVDVERYHSDLEEAYIHLTGEATNGPSLEIKAEVQP